MFLSFTTYFFAIIYKVIKRDLDAGRHTSREKFPQETGVLNACF